MKLKRIAAGAAVAGALGFASIGIGAGQAKLTTGAGGAGAMCRLRLGNLSRRLDISANGPECRRVTGISRGSGGGKS